MENTYKSTFRLISTFVLLTVFLFPGKATEANQAIQPYIPQFVYHPLVTGIIDPMAVSSADLDKDGDKDILASGHFQGLLWFENNGNQNFTQRYIHPQFYGHAITAADLDNDGDNDVFLTSFWCKTRSKANLPTGLYVVPYQLIRLLPPPSFR